MKKYLKFIFAAVLVIVIAVVSLTVIEIYNRRVHVEEEKIDTIYCSNGITGQSYDMTADEIKTVRDELKDYRFSSENKGRNFYRMCIIVKIKGGQIYTIKPASKENIEITSGAVKKGIYFAPKTAKIINKYEKQYGTNLFFD